MVAIFAEAMLSGRRPKVRGDGGQTRDYVFVEDLVDAAARAVEQGGSGTWNLGTGIETSVNRLLEILSRELHYSEAPERVPLPPGEQRRSVLDGSLVRRQFDLPAWTPIDKGLAATAAWFSAQHSPRQKPAS